MSTTFVLIGYFWQAFSLLIVIVLTLVVFARIVLYRGRPARARKEVVRFSAHPRRYRDDEFKGLD